MTSRIPPATLPLSEAAQRGGIPFCSRRRRDTDCCVCVLLATAQTAVPAASRRTRRRSAAFTDYSTACIYDRPTVSTLCGVCFVFDAALMRCVVVRVPYCTAYVKCILCATYAVVLHARDSSMTPYPLKACDGWIPRRLTRGARHTVCRAPGLSSAVLHSCRKVSLALPVLSLLSAVPLRRVESHATALQHAIVVMADGETNDTHIP